MKSYLTALALLLFLGGQARAQCGFTPDFNLLGGVTRNGDCYQLTDSAATNSKVAMWNRTTISLAYDFDFTFSTTQCGTADGFVFALHNNGSNANPNGTAGGTLNYYNTAAMARSIAVEMDIYSNRPDYNDVDSSHIALVGNASPVPLAGPILIDPYLGDCSEHFLRITWKAATHQIWVFLDGARLFARTEDLVTTRFNGNPQVTFGFTASTGAEISRQTICPLDMLYGGAAQVSIRPQGPTRLCLPDSVELRATALRDSGATYSWTPSLSLSHDTGRNVVARPAQTTLYRVETRFVGGCVARDSILVHANPKPELALLPADSVCLGRTTTLWVAQTARAAKYRWSPGQDLDRDTGLSVSATPIADTWYRVVATSDSGCAVTDSVLVQLRRPLSFSFSNIQFCPADSARIAVPYFGHAATYAWTPTTGLTNRGYRGAVAKPTASTYYTLVATDTLGCTGRASVTVFPAPQPFPEINIKFNHEQGTMTGTIADVLFGPPMTRTEWDFGDNSPIDSTRSVQHTYQPGRYKGTLTYFFGPGCRVVTPWEYRSNYIPNVITPDGDKRNDTFAPILADSVFSVILYNRYGKQVFKSASYSGNWGPDAAPGTYFYRIAASGGKTYTGWVEVVKE